MLGSGAPVGERQAWRESLAHGPRGIGKSVLLRRLYWDYFENQDDEIPLINVVDCEGRFDPKRWAWGFLCEVGQQLVAWFTRDAALAGARLMAEEVLVEQCRRRGLSALADGIENFDAAVERCGRRGGGAALAEWAMELVIESARVVERPVVLFLDGADGAWWMEQGQRVRLSEAMTPLDDGVDYFRRLWSGLCAPTDLHPLLPGIGFADRAVMLEPLNTSGAELFFESQAKAMNLDYDGEVARNYIDLFGGMPRYISNFARTAKRMGREAVLSAEDFVDIYLEDIRSGCTARDLRRGLERGGALPSPEQTGRVMAQSLDWPENKLEGLRGSRDEAQGDWWTREARVDSEAILERLALSGLCVYRNGRWAPSSVGYLSDYMRLFIGEHLSGLSADRTLVTIKRGLLVNASNRQYKHKSLERLEDIELVMRHFCGQNVPSRWMGAHEENAEHTENLSKADKARVRLPFCIGSFIDTALQGARRAGPTGAGLPVVVGWCFAECDEYYRSDESLWVAHVPSALVITTEELDYIERVQEHLARELNVSHVRGWLISDARYSQDARKRVRTMPLHCTSWSGFNELGELVLSRPTRPGQESTIQEVAAEPVEDDEQMAEPERQALGRNSLELRLPPRNGVELFASRALEDLAASVGYPHRQIDQMQSAIMEAVLNAVERSANREKMIFVRLEAMRDRFKITVENEGETFDPQKVEKPSLASKRQKSYKRGWGLALMQRMMDRVVLDDRPYGTRVRMEKFAPPEDENSTGDNKKHTGFAYEHDTEDN